MSVCYDALFWAIDHEFVSLRHSGAIGTPGKEVALDEMRLMLGKALVLIWQF